MKKQLKEVEERLLHLQTATDDPSPWKPYDYIGGGQSQWTYSNLKIPLVRKVS